MYICMHVVVFVSMCVSEGNRETKSVCVCVCVCVWKRVGYQGVLTGWQKRETDREKGL